jgi:hypothetical protein
MIQKSARSRGCKKDNVLFFSTLRLCKLYGIRPVYSFLSAAQLLARAGKGSAAL